MILITSSLFLIYQNTMLYKSRVVESDENSLLFLIDDLRTISLSVRAPMFAPKNFVVQSENQIRIPYLYGKSSAFAEIVTNQSGLSITSDKISQKLTFHEKPVIEIVESNGVQIGISIAFKYQNLGKKFVFYFGSSPL